MKSDDYKVILAMLLAIGHAVVIALPICNIYSVFCLFLLYIS